jgi:Flp pilus assembly protein CpaB
LGAALLAFFYLDRLRREALPEAHVVVLTDDKTAGIELTDADVTLKAVPLDVIPEGSLDEEGRAVGRTLARSMRMNEILLNSDFAGEVGSGLSAQLPDGRWALVFPVGWLMSPVPSIIRGDHLDLMAYQAGQPVDQVGMIVSNVEVLDFQGSSSEPERLILAVDLDQAIAIIYARSNGFSILSLLRPEMN